MKQKTLLALVCFSLLLGNALMLGYVLYVTHGQGATGRAQNSGVAVFCINSPPVINVTCNSTMSQGTQYSCRLNFTDAQDNNVTFSLAAPTIFNVSSNGTINFTPTNADVGNHTAFFIADDGTGCPNSMSNASFNFSVANINDPPYLSVTIPDRTFPANTSISAFFLTDYFIDPDGDPMVFTATTPLTMTLTILPSSEVVFSSNTCNADELVRFTATDPSNASGVSNNVEIKVSCQQTASTGGSGKGEGSGGGGGGGVTCKPLWECDDWFACLPTGIQWQRCYDKHGCSAEKYLKRDCKYQGPPPACQENWLCQDWGQCLMNGSQSRSCRDLSECGSSVMRPPLSQSCTYEPTCNDNVQNGNETGIDCGGICASCAIVQQPSLISSQAGLPWWLLLIIILSVLIVSGVAHYYRAEIAQAIATLGFMLRHRAYKDILLDAPQRKSFFERLWAFEQLLATPVGKEMKPGAVYATLATLIRQYYVDALVVQEEVIREEVAARCKELVLRQETTELLLGLFTKLDIIEQAELELDSAFILATLEELRTVVCLTSDYKTEELLRPVEELAVSEQMSFYDEIFTRIINGLRAVQFHDTETGRKEYMTMLSRYDPLSEPEKEQIYPELQWIYTTVKFQSEITGARVVKKPTAA